MRKTRRSSGQLAGDGMETQRVQAAGALNARRLRATTSKDVHHLINAPA